LLQKRRDGKRDQEPDYEGIDYSSLSDDDLQKAFDQTQGKTAKNLGLGSMLAGATPIGAAVGFGNAVSASQIANEIELRTGVRPETKGGLMSKVADFITGADKEVSMSEVVGKDDSGKDTYGAVKGFDSGMGAVAAPPERPDRTTGQDKNDEEKAGGFNSPDRLTGGGR
jgi:hypothetical protein